MSQILHIITSNFQWTPIFFIKFMHKWTKMYSIYSSTKTAMVNFAQAISDEWADDGIVSM